MREVNNSRLINIIYNVAVMFKFVETLRLPGRLAPSAGEVAPRPAKNRERAGDIINEHPLAPADISGYIQPAFKYLIDTDANNYINSALFSFNIRPLFGQYAKWIANGNRKTIFTLYIPDAAPQNMHSHKLSPAFL